MSEHLREKEKEKKKEQCRKKANSNIIIKLTELVSPPPALQRCKQLSDSTFRRIPHFFSSRANHSRVNRARGFFLLTRDLTSSHSMANGGQKNDISTIDIFFYIDNSFN
ncbi:hypothetical protein CEXT_495501 [Caerostris extrusa]|uniref:Uncharacterized protein n=1 Tax=Caerostris extrusa TaxID=172846 RepID=A0AAV4Q247_CAEEX|nr:hypothetical protein CEXT_495501 [Caerostris extrusa]